MTDYFRDARSVTRALGRVRRAALPPAPTPIRLIGENLMWVVEGITFADAASAAAAPAEWLRAFEAAVSRNVPVADDALALMEREQQRHNYPPEVFLPTAEHQRRVLQFLRPRPGPLGAARRDARLRPARRDVSRAERDCVPRDARLLSQVHRRRAHAARRCGTPSACSTTRDSGRFCGKCTRPSCSCCRCCITTSARRVKAITPSSAPRWRRR